MDSRHRWRCPGRLELPRGPELDRGTIPQRYIDEVGSSQFGKGTVVRPLRFDADGRSYRSKFPLSMRVTFSNIQSLCFKFGESHFMHFSIVIILIGLNNSS